jgi:hypothetical protein
VARDAEKSTPQGKPWGVNLYLKGTFIVKEEELLRLVKNNFVFSTNL